ncbi:polyprotein [Hirsutella rhossiliensis]
MEQRARGAYIASICQPEATCDMSTAAQVQQPTDTDCITLNKRLKWQQDNLQRGIQYVPLDLQTAKLMVFTDGSFANNKDLSSQIGFLVMLVNEKQESSEDLGTTKEKRLMIDIMALRQSYERREILEVRWINGNDNPADAMTKASPNKALERFISTNQLTIRVEGSVHRPV